MTIWHGVLEKIDEYKWRIPKSYKPGMRVDGVIYADDKMIADIRSDKAAEQVANVAFLPGIVKHSLAMPDIHWGYGFCLTKDAEILTNFGFYKRISDFEKDWRIQKLLTFDSQAQKMTPTSIVRFLKLEPKPIYRVTTKTGYEIKATGDHPLLTPSGMRSVKELARKAKIAVLPFKGVPYEEPSHEVIVSEDDIKKTLVKLGRAPGTPKFDIIMQKLKKRGLLPLSYAHPAIPFILKIMGFVFGDGTMNFIGKRGDGIVHFAGKFQDLVEARQDLEKIGYTAGNIHIRRVESSREKNKYYTSCLFAVNAASLVVLLESLGVPRGRKVTQPYRIPAWIMKGPLWQKRLFLSSLFGCELRIPHRRLRRRGYFNAPAFPMAKSEKLLENGKDFLRDMESLLLEFGVKTLYIDKRKRHISTKGIVTWALELVISPKPQNLFNLWSKVGFEYNFERSFVAGAAVNYLKLKLKILREKEDAIKTLIPGLLLKRLSYEKIAAQLAGNPITRRFVIDVCWKLNKGKSVIPRIPANFPLFEDYLKEAAKDLGHSGVIWDDVEKIEELSRKERVYDFTVSHPDHNFVANNFVVSNCIGGVAATDVDEGGVISPGGVGFDINCLSNSLILNELGYVREIKEYEADFVKHELTCLDFNVNKSVSTGIVRFLKQRPKKTVLNIITETERQIEATVDHPFYTRHGMRDAGKMSAGDEVAVYPFEGVDYAEPSDEIIVDEGIVKGLFFKIGKSAGGNAVKQIMKNFANKKILPLRYNSPQLPYLIKMLGYCFGDGLLYFDGKRKRGATCFYGKNEDLIRIKMDLAAIGFKGAIYSRQRHHRIKTSYSIAEFDNNEFWLRASSNSFALLMAALGMPAGNKCRQPYRLPEWLFRAPLWQKRLFLAAFFGAEMSSPSTLTGHGYNFYCPTISMNKTRAHIDNGRRFLEDIAGLIREFGVSSHEISERKEFVNEEGLISHRLRLMVSDKTDNLLKLYGRIGFEYNEDRKFLANAAVGYLKLKNTMIREKGETAALAPVLAATGEWERESIYDYLKTPHITARFIERSLYEPRKTAARAWDDFPTFEEFLKTATEGLGRSGMIWERIKSISDVKDYNGWVYDFTVAHKDHNFIANNFVVSNCGVRLVKTNLAEKDVRPRLRDLVYALYNDIPAGVGSKGDIRISEAEERKLLVDGAKWVVDHGYGRPEDLEHTEERGAIKGAEPDKVSPRAYERGKNQSGTLGSGNHFLEVQVIEEIYDEAAADAFGLEKGQVTLMIHSGSRGLGYQVCDEYSKDMIGCLSKYKIEVPDRQLACAPVKSEEGRAYLGAMKCAANYAWANRQCLMHLARAVFEKVFQMGPKDLGMDLIYDIAHNIAKIEKYNIGGRERTLCVHRKGATRAFGPGHPELPPEYQKTGQPVIIPGDMGRNSYLLVGTKKAEETFWSACHGAGRRLSRTAAVRACRGRSISRELENKGIIVKSSGRETLSEEAPEAYKDVNEVVSVVEGAGISRRVCRMRPIGVIKG